MSIYKASAPGSLMLLGEYAVLENYPAIVAAIDKRMHVTLTPLEDERLVIRSSLGAYQGNIHHIESVAPFSFVLTAFQYFKKHLKTGCDLFIESEFSHDVGFASSAAVTVATLSALTAWLNLSYSPLEKILLARSIIQAVQGLGSGADVAACTLGGVVAYQMEPLAAVRLSEHLPLTVVYSGSKTPTVQAVRQVKSTFSKHPHLYKKIMQAIGECAAEGKVALEKKDDKTFVKMMTIQQGLMHALGANTSHLQQLIDALIMHPSILSAKISGSGMGDCVVAYGELDTSIALPGQRMNVHVESQGVVCEKI